MNVCRWLRSQSSGSCAAVFCLILSGCAISGNQIDPEVLFQSTMHQLSVDDYVIQWEDAGSVISQQTMDMNWNPVKNSERLLSAATAITIDQEKSDPQIVVLSAILDRPMAKQVLMDQLHNQMNVIRIEAPYIQQATEHLFTTTDDVRMNKEIEAFIDQADRQLMERLATSEVHSTIFLWIKRSTEKPIRVQFHSTIHDMQDAHSLKETLMDSYLIS